MLRETYSNYCGGAHPNAGISSYQIWDLVKDRPVEMQKWIKGNGNDTAINSERLLKLLAARYSRRNEKGNSSCADALDGSKYYFMYPTSAGMVFSPSLSHGRQACAEDIEIPWVKMQPFLTAFGQKAAQDFVGVP